VLGFLAAFLQDVTAESVQEAYDKFAELPLKNFQWDQAQVRGEDGDKVHIGVLAQELQRVLPEAVSASSAAVEGLEPTETLYIDMDHMFYTMAAVVQELQRRVHALEAEREG